MAAHSREPEELRPEPDSGAAEFRDWRSLYEREHERKDPGSATVGVASRWALRRAGCHGHYPVMVVNVMSLSRLISTVLLLVLPVFSAERDAPAPTPEDFVRFSWEDRSSNEKSGFRRVVLDSRGSVRIELKPAGKDLIGLEFNLEPPHRSILVENLSLLLTRSDFFKGKAEVAGQREPEGENGVTLQVDYGDSEVTFRTRTFALVPAKDPNLQVINAFFRNLCRQELALLELKTALMQDRSQLLARMQQLDRDLRSERVPVPDRLIPVLERISRDPAVMNEARILAGRIADGIHASVAAMGAPRQEAATRAEPSGRLAGSPSRTAADPSSQEGTLRVFVELVELDVIVTDRKGRQVTDLQQADFQVLRDDVPQDIHSLAYLWVQPTILEQQPARRASKGSLDPSGGTAPPLNLQRQRRSIAVVVDELGLGFGSVNPAKKGLGEFIRGQIQPNDLVALVRTGVETEQIHFTSDKKELLEALEQVKYNPMSRQGLHRSTARPHTRATMIRDRNLAMDTLATLWKTVSAMKRLPFRKSLILVSDGFHTLDTQFAIDNGIQQATHHLADACHRASVVIYTIDGRGLQTQRQFTAEISSSEFSELRSGIGGNRSSIMSFLARETGGIYFKYYNFPEMATRRILRDQQGYYRLAFTPDQSAPRAKGRRFGKIKVQVNRRGLKVRSRSAAFSF
ncbi:MAG: VWA domain-containing protein [Acidobacteria bacterium]|nr:VWA domain-containing protein [Acidobacteriota bacterium]